MSKKRQNRAPLDMADATPAEMVGAPVEHAPQKPEGAEQKESPTPTATQTNEPTQVADNETAQDGVELSFIGKDGEVVDSFSFVNQHPHETNNGGGDADGHMNMDKWERVRIHMNGKDYVAVNANTLGVLDDHDSSYDDWGVDYVPAAEEDPLGFDTMSVTTNEPESEPSKSVAECIQEEDYLRFGVDPERDNKKQKDKGPSLLQLLNPKLLKTSVEKYGFKFEAKKFFLYIFASLAAAVATGFLFQLDWYFIVLIGVVAAMCVPSIFLASLKGMYTAKQFHDVSDYMEQLLYSFRRKRKILTALEDVYTAFEDDTGPMKELVGKAIEHIRTADTTGDIHREALDIIEKEYSNDRLRSIHNFLIAVENNGGKVETSVDLLLDERSMWDERVHLFQKEKGTIKRNITVSIVFSLALCFAILFIFSVDTLAELQIPKNMLVQITSTAAILLNLLLFVSTTNKFSQSWLIREKKQSDYQIMKDYFYVENYNPAKERKQSIIWGAGASLIWIFGLLLQNTLLIIAGVLITLFCLFSSKISYNLCKKSTTKELQKAFPQWMMELALILQTDNVQVAISKTLDSAPAVLRPELELLVERFDESPHSLKPYLQFLEDYDLSDIKSAMKMLYSVSASGTGNIDEQISDLIKKQNSLMDKAEKIMNGDQLAGMTSINMVPMLFCILKSVVDMTVLVLSMFTLMSF